VSSDRHIHVRTEALELTGAVRRVKSQHGQLKIVGGMIGAAYREFAGFSGDPDCSKNWFTAGYRIGPFDGLRRVKIAQKGQLHQTLISHHRGQIPSEIFKR
jgi:hypothetical protein